MNLKKIKNIDWKKIKNYSLYVLPFYGAIDQFIRTPKEKRSTLGIIGAGIGTVVPIAKIVGIALAVYHVGTYEGDGEKNKHIDSNVDSLKINNITNKNNLEKTVMYEKLLKIAL
jgi:hypothetical protein